MAEIFLNWTRLERTRTGKREIDGELLWCNYYASSCSPLWRTTLATPRCWKSKDNLVQIVLLCIFRIPLIMLIAVSSCSLRPSECCTSWAVCVLNSNWTLVCVANLVRYRSRTTAAMSRHEFAVRVFSALVTERASWNPGRREKISQRHFEAKRTWSMKVAKTYNQTGTYVPL